MIRESWKFGVDYGDIRPPKELSKTGVVLKKPSGPGTGNATPLGLRKKCKKGMHLQCFASRCSCECHKPK